MITWSSVTRCTLKVPLTINIIARLRAVHWTVITISIIDAEVPPSTARHTEWVDPCARRSSTCPSVCTDFNSIYNLADNLPAAASSEVLVLQKKLNVYNNVGVFFKEVFLHIHSYHIVCLNSKFTIGFVSITFVSIFPLNHPPQVVLKFSLGIVVSLRKGPAAGHW